MLPTAMSDWLIYLGFGALLGAFGQLIRASMGLKKMREDDLAKNRAFGACFSPAEFVTSIVIGAVAGVLAMLLLKPDVESVEIKLVLGIMAAGYAGADFIDGAVGKLFSKGPITEPHTSSDAIKASSKPVLRAPQDAIQADASSLSDASYAPLDWVMSRPSAREQNWRAS